MEVEEEGEDEPPGLLRNEEFDSEVEEEEEAAHGGLLGAPLAPPDNEDEVNISMDEEQLRAGAEGVVEQLQAARGDDGEGGNGGQEGGTGGPVLEPRGGPIDAQDADEVEVEPMDRRGEEDRVDLQPFVDAEVPGPVPLAERLQDVEGWGEIDSWGAWECAISPFFTLEEVPGVSQVKVTLTPTNNIALLGSSL